MQRGDGIVMVAPPSHPPPHGHPWTAAALIWANARNTDPGIGGTCITVDHVGIHAAAWPDQCCPGCGNAARPEHPWTIPDLPYGVTDWPWRCPHCRVRWAPTLARLRWDILEALVEPGPDPARTAQLVSAALDTWLLDFDAALAE